MNPDSKTYHIRTLADIYNLPTFEHIERCLADLYCMMKQARAINGEIERIAQSKGLLLEGDRAMTFPEVVDWTDDDKGNVDLHFLTPDGSEVLTMHTKRD